MWHEYNRILIELLHGLLVLYSRDWRAGARVWALIRQCWSVAAAVLVIVVVVVIGTEIDV